MKKIMTAALVMAAILCGCASTSGNKIYTINSRGTAEIGNNIEAAQNKSLQYAREEMVYSIDRFLDFKFSFDEETKRKIASESRVVQGKRTDGWYVTELTYTLDLFDFLSDNAGFKNFNTWELMGMSKYYDHYMTGNKPIGVWVQEKLAQEITNDPVNQAVLCLIPAYSGNFAVGKNLAGGFFALAKTAALLTAIFHPENGAKIAAYAGLGVITALDFYSVIFETTESIKKLEALKDALSGQKNEQKEKK
ncbi:MAG TPA: hypothetical protein PLB12_00080 [Candidatus Goldiibacteriota bacterium]|nr:hypothetical protein [Candidatus Goldiibacteriota bacterium]HPN63581.1 hypothetical protein [Candidatus Goldiibacteriota bacterium]HRQ42728.1 hypothetical protein [Candidatus Goldiibacteriota bacterium]